MHPGDKSHLPRHQWQSPPWPHTQYAQLKQNPRFYGICPAILSQQQLLYLFQYWTQHILYLTQCQWKGSRPLGITPSNMQY